jgi:hypothetical protein
MALEFSPRNSKTEEAVHRIIGEIEKWCGGKLFCFYQDSATDESIDYAVVQKVRESLSGLGQQKKLYVLIDSSGGDAHAAFHLVTVLRRCGQELHVIVSEWAKSAATLVCLGADTIHMAKDAELGPLDAQLRDPTGSSKPKSALNVFKALEHLQRYSIESLDLATVLFIKKSGMDIPYAIEKALGFVACIVAPLYEQVDPMELGEAGRELEVGEEYCKRIMKRYGYHSLSSEQIQSMTYHLVRQYPTHGFVIDIEEAKDIGLHTQALPDHIGELCAELLSKTTRCVGFLETATDKPAATVRKHTRRRKSTRPEAR